MVPIMIHVLFSLLVLQKPSMGAGGQELSIGADGVGYHTHSFSQTQNLCLRNFQRQSFPMQKNNNIADLLCLLNKENCLVCSSCMWSRRFHVLVKFQQNWLKKEVGQFVLRFIICSCSIIISAYAQYILQNLHEYRSITNTISLLKSIHKM
jgi:hypothetical protein